MFAGQRTLCLLHQSVSTEIRFFSIESERIGTDRDRSISSRNLQNKRKNNNNKKRNPRTKHTCAPIRNKRDSPRRPFSGRRKKKIKGFDHRDLTTYATTLESPMGAISPSTFILAKNTSKTPFCSFAPSLPPPLHPLRVPTPIALSPFSRPLSRTSVHRDKCTTQTDSTPPILLTFRRFLRE